MHKYLPQERSFYGSDFLNICIDLSRNKQHIRHYDTEWITAGLYYERDNLGVVRRPQFLLLFVFLFNGSVAMGAFIKTANFWGELS